jgi:hypothetical protein
MGDDTIDITAMERTGARKCGGCTLCCKLIPVPALKKPAGARCQYQRAGKGCTIHSRPGIRSRQPASCEAWACRWLAEAAETIGMPRPDRAHYVLDPLTDFIRLTHMETGEPTDVASVQVWIDPAFPEARNSPHLRAFILRMARDHQMPTILRWNNKEVTVVWAPLTDDAQWLESTVPADMGVGLYSQLPEDDRPPL